VSLEDADTFELTDRYNYLVQEYVKLSVELAGKLEKFGKYKKELEMLTVEFVRRGVDVKDSEPLTNLIKDELEKREIKEDGQQKKTDL
jgi:hypothetical protein